MLCGQRVAAERLTTFDGGRLYQPSFAGRGFHPAKSIGTVPRRRVMRHLATRGAAGQLDETVSDHQYRTE
jgi:hypothetical protein